MILTHSDRLVIRDVLDSPEALDEFLYSSILDMEIGATKRSNTTSSLSAVRSVISSESHIQEASTFFFEEFLQRMNGTKTMYRIDKWYYLHDFCKVLPERHSYEAGKFGDPSWMEKQRVHQTLWLLQFYFDLVAITRPILGISSQVWDLLKNEGPRRIWLYKKPTWESYEMDCVYEFLHDASNAIQPHTAHRPHFSKIPATEPKFWTAPKTFP